MLPDLLVKIFRLFGGMCTHTCASEGERDAAVNPWVFQPQLHNLKSTASTYRQRLFCRVDIMGSTSRRPHLSEVDETTVEIDRINVEFRVLTDDDVTEIARPFLGAVVPGRGTTGTKGEEEKFRKEQEGAIDSLYEGEETLEIADGSKKAAVNADELPEDDLSPFQRFSSMFQLRHGSREDSVEIINEDTPNRVVGGIQSNRLAMGPINAGHSAPVDESDDLEAVQQTEIEDPNSEEEPDNKKDEDCADTGLGDSADGSDSGSSDSGSSDSGKSESIEDAVGHGEKWDLVDLGEGSYMHVAQYYAAEWEQLIVSI